MTAHVRTTVSNRLVVLFAALGIACVVALILPLAAHAATYHVAIAGNDSTGDGSVAKPYATIHQAMLVATPGDVVAVAPGFFSEDVTMTAGVSLEGAGSALTTLYGTGTRSVIVASNAGATMISGLTIKGGSAAYYGSGIYCYRCSPTITGNMITGNGTGTVSVTGSGINCSECSSPTITGNTITDNIGGSGIACSNCSSPTITGDFITGNSASAAAGIYCTNCTSLTIASDTIAGNRAVTNAGGVMCDDCTSPTISGDVITGNRAGVSGGGMIVSNCSSATITGVIITGNTGGSWGGGIWCMESSPTISSDLVAGNQANFGGGMYFDTSGPTLTGDTIVGNTVGNTVGNSGGGVYCKASSPSTMTNDIIADNRAWFGGGIYLAAANATLTNDTIADNIAPGCGGVWCNSGTQALTNCILWGNNMQLYHCSTAYCDLQGGGGGTGSISADPLFVASGMGDYHLSAGSPCIDTATSTAAPATDKDGIGRPWGASFDMGAYEFYVASFPTKTSLSRLRSLKPKWLALSGKVSAPGSPYVPSGQVTVLMSRKIGKLWRGAGSARVRIVRGAYTYSFKPPFSGVWRFKARYDGGVIGPTTYTASTSAVLVVTVK